MSEEIQPATPIAPEYAALVDAESLGEKILEPIKRTQPEEVLAWMREKFKQGYVMYATDVKAPVLEGVKGMDGESGFATGLTIQPRHRIKDALQS